MVYTTIFVALFLFAAVILLMMRHDYATLRKAYIEETQDLKARLSEANADLLALLDNSVECMARTNSISPYNAKNILKEYLRLRAEEDNRQIKAELHDLEQGICNVIRKGLI